MEWETHSTTEGKDAEGYYWELVVNHLKSRLLHSSLINVQIPLTQGSTIPWVSLVLLSPESQYVHLAPPDLMWAHPLTTTYHSPVSILVVHPLRPREHGVLHGALHLLP